MSCTLVLIDCKGAYLPGHKIFGKVVCTLVNQEQVQEITIGLVGEEHTSWTTQEGYHDAKTRTRPRYATYQGDNTFLTMTTTLNEHSKDQISISRSSEIDEKTISQKSPNNEYSFSLALPKDLPGSFRSDKGKIIFYLEAKVETSLGGHYEDIQYFNVNAPLDLNDLNDFELNPIKLQDETVLCCFCCASDPLNMDVYLDRAVYAKGETMKIKVDISNRSNESVRELKAELKMTTKTITTEPPNCMKEETVVASVNDTGVEANSSRTYNLDLHIPNDTNVRNFKKCTLFKQSCRLQIMGVLGDWHLDLVIVQDITLGHIPPRSKESEETVNMPYTNDATAAFPPYPYPDKQTPYPTSPPTFPTQQARDSSTSSFSGASDPLIGPYVNSRPYPTIYPSMPLQHGRDCPSSDRPGVHEPLIGPLPRAHTNDATLSAPSVQAPGRDIGFGNIDYRNTYDVGQSSTSSYNEPPPPNYSEAIKGQPVPPPKL